MVRKLIYLRPWIKVARDYPEKRGHYPDGAVAALTFAFCKAAEQPEPGTFASVGVLKALLDATGQRRGRWVRWLVEHGDVVVGAKGTASLPKWVAFQTADLSTKRVHKHRDKGAETPTETVSETRDETPAETETPSRESFSGEMKESLSGQEPLTRLDERPPSGGDESAPAFDDEAPEHDARVWLVRHGCYVPEGNGYHRSLIRTVDQHGVGTVVKGFETLAEAGVQDGDTKGFVFGVEDLLRKRPDLRKVAEREAADRTARQLERDQLRLRELVKGFPA